MASKPVHLPYRLACDIHSDSVFAPYSNQLCAFAAELEELKVEISNTNNFLDRELRTQLQQANDEIYRLRYARLSAFYRLHDARGALYRYLPPWVR